MCYTCTHCNQCGLYSTEVIIVCANCKEPMPIGTNACPKCGGTKIESMVVPASQMKDRSRGNPGEEQLKAAQ